MLSSQAVSVPRGEETRSFPLIRPLPRSLQPGNYASPARSMPVEVISNMFGFASHSFHDPIAQSIAISHVCRQWREIALSMPSLWTLIHLSLPLTKSQLTRTRAWMIRSRNGPLDIHMDFRDPSWDWDEASHVFGCDAMDNIMRFLVPQASRWQSIELLTDTWAPIFTFLSRTAAIDSVPLLRTIRLARCNEYFVAQGEVFRPTNLALPVAWFRGGAGLRRLHHVSLSGVHVDWTRCGLADLRELELRYHARDVMPTLSEFRRILSANAGLQRLVILGWGARIDQARTDARESDGLQTIDLAQLEEFEFGFVDVGHATDLLSSFAFPNLRTLSVEDVAFGIRLCERQDCSRLFRRLVEMRGAEGEPSLASLRELSLRSVHADDASIQSLFGHSRALTSLCLDRVDVRALGGVCSALAACDRLRALTLRHASSAAAALVLSSCSLPPCLRVFLDIDDADGGEEDVDCGDTGSCTIGSF